MITKMVVVLNATGLHARPASEFVALAKTFEAKITIRKAETDRPAVNAKSVLRVLSEGCDCGTRLEIAADGIDEAEAVERLTALITSGFGEISTGE